MEQIIINKEKFINYIRNLNLTKNEIHFLSSCIEIASENIEDDWIPCKERLPAEKQHVQVTYLGYHNGLPYCDAFAYMCDQTWFWCFDDDEVIVEIVAWKPNCEPYKGD